MLESLDYTKRVFIINGNTRDIFITSNIIEHQFDSMLLYWLKNDKKYSRVIFIDTRGLYFLDKESHDLSMFVQNIEQKKEAPKGLMKRKKGLTTNPEVKKEVNSTNADQSTKRYHNLIELTELRDRVFHWMRNSNIPTAVVFYDDSFLDKYNINNDTYNRFRGDLNTEFMNLPVENRNIIFFIYHELSEIELSHKMIHRGLDFLFSFTNGKNSGFAGYYRVGTPDRDEIEGFFNRLRVINEFSLEFNDEKNYQKAVSNILSLVKTKQISLKKLKELFLNFKTISEKTVFEILEKEGIKMNKTSAWEEFDKLISLKNIKNEVKNFINGGIKTGNIIKDNKTKVVARLKNKKINQNIKENRFHLILTGNPGTGKTTVANLIGRVLQEEGVLESGHTIKVTRGDLVGAHIGETEIKTKRKIDEAMGGVLFIDEAYSLIKEESQNDFGKIALDEILEAMTDKAGLFVVIMAGYPNEMRTVVASNPGLERRVNIINIPDYTAQELKDIMLLKFKNFKLSNYIEDNILNFTSAILENRAKYGGEHFGNGGVIENITSKTIQKFRARGGDIIEVYDFESKERDYFKFKIKDSSSDINSILRELETLIGLQNVKNSIHDIYNATIFDKERGVNDSVNPGHYLFVGNPGTGKTTVARVMANILHSIGVLKTNKIVSKTASDFIASYVGESENRTKKIFNEALGGTLFIDEAHQFFNPSRVNHGFGEEVLKTLVPLMEDNRDSISIIFAGYPKEISDMLKFDPGLEGRFSNRVVFDDYSEFELLEILKIFFKKELFILNSSISEDFLFDFMKKIKNRSDFANGRTVRNLVESIKKSVATRFNKAIDKTNLSILIDDKKWFYVQIEDFKL